MCVVGHPNFPLFLADSNLNPVLFYEAFIMILFMLLQPKLHIVFTQCETRDQKVLGSHPMWLVRYGHMLPNWFIKGLVVCKAVYGYVHLIDPLESFGDYLPGFSLSPI